MDAHFDGLSKDSSQRKTLSSAFHGVPSKKVLSQLLPYTRADGSSLNERLEDLSITGLDRFPPSTSIVLSSLKEPSFRLATSAGRAHAVAAWTLAQRTAALRGV